MVPAKPRLNSTILWESFGDLADVFQQAEVLEVAGAHLQAVHMESLTSSQCSESMTSVRVFRPYFSPPALGAELGTASLGFNLSNT